MERASEVIGALKRMHHAPRLAFGIVAVAYRVPSPPARVRVAPVDALAEPQQATDDVGHVALLQGRAGVAPVCVVHTDLVVLGSCAP